MERQSTAASDLVVGPRLVAAHWTSVWIAGDPTALEPPLVAIVGTREADRHGLALSREFAATLARENVSVLSGGALGIDAAAHAGAVEANGRTAVVLPSGLDHLYPLRHQPLYETIVERGGALVSPFPPETPPARWTFPRRNALLAAMCDLLLVIQAPVSSGSLITAECARKLGRRVLVVPASPGDPRGGGCLKLLRMGAELCATPADVLVALAHRDGPLQGFAQSTGAIRERETSGDPDRPRARSRTRTHVRAHDNSSHPTPREPAAPPPPPGGWTLDDDARSVYDSLDSEPRHLDEVAQQVGLGAARTRRSLLTLVLLGLVSDRGNGIFRRAG